MPEYDTLVLGIGIALGMVYHHRTGWACGGIITPGIVAMHLGEPATIGVSFGAALITFALLEAGVRMFGLYGKQRIAAAMLTALILRSLLRAVLPLESLWLGWVVPGLMAADFQRQGTVPTSVGALSTALASAMAVEVLLVLT